MRLFGRETHPILEAARRSPSHPDYAEGLRAALEVSRLIFPAGPEGGGLKIAHVRDAQETEWVAAFTTERTARRWKADENYASLPAVDVFRLAQEHGVGVLVDPAGPQRLSFEADAVALILSS